MTILVDVDNVLEDLNQAWVNAVNEKYGTNVSPNDIVSWDIEQFFDGLSRTQVFSPLHDKRFWESLEPIDGAPEYLKKLIDDGYQVLLVTSSHPDTIQYKYRFIVKYFPYISFKDIIFASKKQMIRGDVMIDDAPHNLEGGEYLGLLMYSPHNRGYNAEEQGFIRVDNWEQIYNTIKNIVV